MRRGFHPATRDSSSARAHTRKQPRACETRGRKRQGARLARRSRGFPSGRREQGLGFLPARENRSPAWACTRKEPRACETRGRKRHGARIARRSRATCPPQVWAFSLPGKTGAVRGLAPRKNRVRARFKCRTQTRCAICPAQPRDLLTAGAGFLPARENRSHARARTRKQPRACEAGRRHKQGARIARRRRAAAANSS